MAEEQRISTAQAKADRTELTALKRKQSRATNIAARAFGTRNAMAGFGGILTPSAPVAVGSGGGAFYGGTIDQQYDAYGNQLPF